MPRTSSWIALRNPTFGKLWVATVVSGICVSAHETAGIWVMNSLSQSTMFLSLMSTTATLPFFLFNLVWTVSAAELWVAAQRAMPGWARGRMNATVIMVSQGAMALGGILWGTIAATAGVNTALIVAAVLVLVTLTVTHLLRHPW